MHVIKPESLANLPVSGIARMIKADHAQQGKEINYAAAPYVNAMLGMTTAKDAVGADDGEGVILRALCNLGSWRGENARTIKAHLKKLCGVK